MQELTQERFIDIEYALVPEELAQFEQAMHMVCARLGMAKGEPNVSYHRSRHVLQYRMCVEKPDVSAPTPVHIPVPSVESDAPPMEDMREGQP